MAEVRLISPNGESGSANEADVQELLSQGFRLATNEENEIKALRDQFGDQNIKAGLAATARGATFGLSDLALTKSGLVKPETLQGLKLANPDISLAGELAGTIGTAFVGPGAALVKGAAKVGQKTAGKLVTNELAQKIAANAIGSTIEGAAFAATQPISEVALGDPTITAQKAFGQIGLGALLGGVVGTAATALGIGAKKVLAKKIDDIGAVTSNVDDVSRGTIEGAGTIKAKGPLKAEATITFDLPDEKILKNAERLNPKSPLKQNDLDFIKEFGAPDATGKPTIFQKIGTEEIPTLNLAAKDQITLADKLEEGLRKIQSMNEAFEAEANQVLEQTNIVMGRNTYKKMFQDVQREIQKSPDFGTPIGKKAYSRIQEFVDAADDMPAQLSAKQIRENLQMLRQETKIYSAREGLKNDFISQTFNKAQRNMDEYLKTKVQGYKQVMDQYAPMVKLSKELEDHLKMDLREVDSALISNWTENRVVKPFQNQLYGSMKPNMQKDAKTLEKLGQLIGLDIGKTVKANLVYGKLNPELAQGLQKGTWGANIAQNLDLLSRPTEIPGKVVSGTAKMVLTGELPDFIQDIQAKTIQDMLLGKSKGKGIAKSIIDKLAGGTNKFLDSSKGFGKLLTPLSVKGFVDQYDTIEEADKKLETLIAIEKSNIAFDKSVNSTVGSIFESGLPDTTALELAQKPSSQRSEDFDALRKSIATVSNDVAVMIERLTDSIQGVSESAPSVAMSLNMTATRAVNLLQNKLSSIYPEDSSNLLDKPFTPSRDQVASISKTINYINRPQKVLEDLKNKIVSQEGLEVLNQVYPELYADMQAKIMEKVTDQVSKGKLIPIKSRNPLAIFLNQPLDGTQTPSFLQSTQLALSQMTQAEQQKDSNFVNGGAKASPARADKLNVSSRMDTALQRANKR